MKIPMITTARLVLRPFAEEDAVPLHAILAEKDFLRYFPNPASPPLDKVEKHISLQLKHWEEHGFGRWAVELKDKQGLIGWNGLQYLPDTDEIEIGYILAKSCWNQGFTTEGARAGLRFAFEELGLEQLVGIVHPENGASQRVLEKLGMRFTNEAEYFGMDALRYEIKLKESGKSRA
jgi:ribosomal-protein-alanine N-acetyltransferase